MQYKVFIASLVKNCPTLNMIPIFFYILLVIKLMCDFHVRFSSRGGGGLPYQSDGDARRLA